MIDRIKGEGAKVEVYGKEWSETDAKARELANSNETIAYVPPFDDKLLWDGHSTMIDEIFNQLEGAAPDAVVASVGGGGLLAGVLTGLQKRETWAKKTVVVAAETEGAASMHRALEAGKPVHIGTIKTIASSLGAPKVCDEVVSKALSHPAGTKSILVSDKEALAGTTLLLNEHRFLCEPACGAAIAASCRLETVIPNYSDATLVIIVCGGGNISYDLLHMYEEKVAES